MKHISSLFSIILISTSLFAQKLDKTQPPEPEPAPEINIGKHSFFTLENGLKVFVVENHKIPKISYSINFDYDPLLEKEHAGYVGIAGQLIGTATSSRTKQQIDEEKDFIGASLSVSSSGISASVLTKHNEKLLELMSDVVLNAKFNEDELAKIKKQSISAIKAAKNDPKSISSYITNVLLYSKDHPYGEIETEESIESISIEMCKNFYDTYYRPNIAYMAVVGDITPEKTKQLLEQYLGKWQSKKIPEYTYETPQAPEKTKVVILDRPEAVQSVIKVAYPVELNPGSQDYIKASVMNVILGGSGYRLFDNLREKHGWTYRANSSIRSDELIGYFTAYSDVRNEVTDSAVSEILFEMQRLINEPVSDEELQRVKNYMSGNFALSLENAGTIASFAINTAKYNLPEDYYAKYLQNIESLTKKDIQNAARKYMKSENAYVFIVGKADEIAEKLKRISPDILYINTDGEFYNPSEKAELFVPADLYPENIFENYLEYIGGKKKFKTAILHYSMNVNNLNFTLNLYHANNQYAQIVKNNGVEIEKRIFDGKKGYSVSPAGKQEITGIELESLKQNSLFIPQINYLKNRNLFTSIEEIVEINSINCYKVRIKPSEHISLYEYYDIEDFKKVATTEVYDDKEQTMYFKDYKEFDKILLPTVIIQETDKGEFSVTLDKVEFNKKISPEIFN